MGLRSALSNSLDAAETWLLVGSVAALLASCILWSPHKQPWMDEIMTWREVSDPSLRHLFYAIQHGADGGQPLFYATAWLWAKAFGTSVLGLRLYSSVSVCAALIVTWRTVRRFYGMWATAFGALAFWGAAGTLLEQNVEARFYGLFLLTVAVTVAVYQRLLDHSASGPRLYVAAFLSQAALVCSHILGIIDGAVILLALLLVDAARSRLRIKLYLAWAAGWLALLPWLPAIQASMHAGRPHGWIRMPNLTDLRTAYLFTTSLEWLRFFKRNYMEQAFQLVSHIAELILYLALASVFVLCLRALLRKGWRAIGSNRGPILLAAYALLCVPAILFVLSHLITPVFVPRYLLPSGIGLAIVLAACADKLGADRPRHRFSLPRLIWFGCVLFLLISPVLTVMALGSQETVRAYLDVDRLERALPADAVFVAGWQEDFQKLMRLSRGPGQRAYFLLDWPAALKGPRAFVLDYRLMRAYRDNGYYAGHLVNSKDFLCEQPDFWVLDAPNGAALDGHAPDTADTKGLTWFDFNILPSSQFEWKVMDSFDSTEVTRKLIAVHRTGSLPFCAESSRHDP